MTVVNRFFDGFEKVLGWIAALLCLVLLGALFIQVVNRYIFSVSWPVLQLIIPFCFLWMSMIGTAIAIRRNQHFEVDILANYLGHKAQAVQAVIMTLLVIAGGAMIAWTSIGFVELGFLKKNPATGVKMVYIYSSLLTGGVLICLLAFEKLLKQLILGVDIQKEAS